MKIFSKKNMIIALVIVGLITTFSYGILVGRFKIFPYSLVKDTWSSNSVIKGAVAPSMGNVVGNQERLNIETSLLVLEGDKFNVLGEAGLVGSGGAITSYGGIILGVDREGQFFEYKKGGAINKLSLSVTTNKDAFLDFVKSKKISSEHHNKNLDRYFRFMDLQTADIGGDQYIFVSHHYWDDQQNAKTLRVSRLKVIDLPEILGGKEISDSEWEVIYESSPPLFYDESSLQNLVTNHTGGRMIVEEEGYLLVGIGEHRMDGIRYPEIASQDENSSYGKIIRVNLETLESDLFATGIRNPQGLLKDRDGNIWETEHGPRGGDELNMITQGSNFGWPYVTYGTEELSFVWPHSAIQGSHLGYELPIHSWVPSIGISNLIQVNDAPAEWDGDLLLASMKNLTIFRLRVRENRIVLAEPINVGERVRDLVQLDDGSILVLADNARFLELKPDLSEQNSNLTDLLTHQEKALNLGPVITECAVCHSFRESSQVTGAPTLHGVFGRAIGGNSGFEGYSAALSSVGGTWDESSLQSYLSDPQSFAPGSTMPSQGLSDPAQLEALVGFLKRLNE